MHLSGTASSTSLHMMLLVTPCARGTECLDFVVSLDAIKGTGLPVYFLSHSLLPPGPSELRPLNVPFAELFIYIVYIL